MDLFVEYICPEQVGYIIMMINFLLYKKHNAKLNKQLLNLEFTTLTADRINCLLSPKSNQAT